MGKGTKVRHFFTKVAGVSHGNRQKVLAKLSSGDRLNIQHEVDNPADPNAIGLTTVKGRDVGYLHAGMGERILAEAAGGYQHFVIVAGITGGGEGLDKASQD